MPFFIRFEILKYNKHPSWQYHHEGRFYFKIASEYACLDEKEWKQE
jgi:hypothetical protein